MSHNEKILVTGASGHLGQLVLEALLRSGHKNLIATTRDPRNLSKYADQGVEIRTADFKNPSGLEEAFRGATRLLLISTTDVGRRIEQHKNAVDAAKNVGVKHIFYTSWPNTEKSPAAVAPDHAGTEALIKASGLKYTFLRNNLYAENLLHSLPAAIESGTLYGCAGDGRAAYVLREDCANSAAGALINAERFENSVHDISGAKSYSYPELLNLVGEITGKKVSYVDLSPTDLKEGMMKAGLPEQVATLLMSFDLAIKQGDAESVTDAVKMLSGNSARDIREFLTANLKR